MMPVDLLPILLPANGMGKEVEDRTGVWGPCLPWGTQGQVPGSWLQTIQSLDKPWLLWLSGGMSQHKTRRSLKNVKKRVLCMHRISRNEVNMAKDQKNF